MPSQLQLQLYDAEVTDGPRKLVRQRVHDHGYNEARAVPQY